MNQYSQTARPHTPGSSPLPPPPPERPVLKTPPPTSSNRLLGILGVVGLMLAAVLTLLWLSARGDANDARAERDAAVATEQQAVAAAEQARSDLADAQASLAAAQAEADELRANAIDDPAVQARLAELDQVIADRQAAVDELTAANAALQQELTAAQEATAAAEAALAAALAEPEVADDPAGEVTPTEDPAGEPAAEQPVETQTAAPNAPFDATNNPDFARYVGELLSSRSGSSRLAQAQSQCFGTEILKIVGLDGLGQGLYLAATSDANNRVVGAMQQAAATCNIPLELIFR